jgi:hypothetical protein
MAVWFPTRELWDAQFSVFMETCRHVPFAAVTAWVENRVADRWFEAVVDGNVHVELRRSLSETIDVVKIVAKPGRQGVGTRFVRALVDAAHAAGHLGVRIECPITPGSQAWCSYLKNEHGWRYDGKSTYCVSPMRPNSGVSVCPRCSNYIPSNEAPGAFPGAVSREMQDDFGNYLEICSPCGTSEAIEAFTRSHML